MVAQRDHVFRTQVLLRPPFRRGRAPRGGRASGWRERRAHAENRSALHHTLVSIDRDTGMPCFAAPRWTGSPAPHSARSRSRPRRTAGGGDAVVGVRRQGRRVHVACSGVMKPFSYISRMPSSFVAPQTPAWVVTGEAEVAGDLERGLLRELRVAGDVEGQLQAEHVVADGMVARRTRKSGAVAHSHGAPGVAVAEHEPPGIASSASSAASACSASAARATSPVWWSPRRRPPRWPSRLPAGCPPGRKIAPLEVV